MHATATTTTTAAERTDARALVAEIGTTAPLAWVAEEIGRTARLSVAGPTSYRLALLAEWTAMLAGRATATTGLVTAAADDHVRRFLTAPSAWQAEQVALSATIVALDPTPYNVSLLRAWTRMLVTIIESDLIPA